MRVARRSNACVRLSARGGGGGGGDERGAKPMHAAHSHHDCTEETCSRLFLEQFAKSVLTERETHETAEEMRQKLTRVYELPIDGGGKTRLSIQPLLNKENITLEDKSVRLAHPVCSTRHLFCHEVTAIEPPVFASSTCSANLASSSRSTVTACLALA